MKQINRVGLYLILVAFFIIGCVIAKIMDGDTKTFLVSLVLLTLGGFLLSTGKN